MCCLGRLKRKHSTSSASENVTSTRSLASPAPVSASASESSIDASAAELGPAAKRSRRTTLTVAKQQKSNDSVKLATVSPVSEKCKQSTEENDRVPQNCKLSSCQLKLFIIISMFNVA